jgi:PadR family transcriptional regulator PadR
MIEPRMTQPTLKVLRLFMDQPRARRSGADIMRQATIFSGTLYPILIRLEEAGWLASTWEERSPEKLGRPRRRLYKITAAGQNAAQAAFRELGIVTGGRHA